MFKRSLLSDTAFLEYVRPSICFIDADTGDDGGGEAVVTEVDDIAEALAETETPDADDDDHAELEIGADKLRVPKAVKEAWDGLQKTTQTRAEETKAAATTAAQQVREAQEYAAVVQTVSREVARIEAIDAQLAPYLALTRAEWIAWGEQDKVAADHAATAVNALQIERSNIDSAAQKKVKDFQEGRTKSQADFLANAEREIAATIKDWSPAKRAALEKTATSYKGVTPEMFQSVAHIPGALQIIEDAMTLRAARAKASAARPKNNEPAAEPTTRPRSNGGNTATPKDTDSPEVWAKKFRQQYYGSGAKK